MKIKFNKTEDQVKLIKDMASADKAVALKAQEVFAAFVGNKVVRPVLDQAGTTSMIYETIEIGENDTPSIPADLYLDKEVDDIRVWSQSMPGGLATNLPSGAEELRFTFFSLDSAVAFLKKYARQGRLDVVAKGVKRMVNEILVKEEVNGWNPVLAMAAQGSTSVRSGTGKTDYSHIISGGTAGLFKLADLNNLWIRAKRINSSYAGGTAAGLSSAGITDMFISPEVEGDIRAMSFEPVNSTAVPDTNESTALGLDEVTRREIFKAGGATSFFGVTFHTMNEFGTGQIYNYLFDNYYSGSFNPATQEVVVALDLSREAFLRPVESFEGSGTVVVSPDDQFVARQEKIGFFAKVSESFLCIDQRAALGIIL